MKILFRLDASSNVGLGHLRRTMALAKALAQRNHASFFLIDGHGEELPIPLLFPRVNSSVENAPWDIVIVDSYSIKPREYQELATCARRCVVVSDGKDNGFACDALIDHNVYATEAMYAHRQSGKTLLWVGPQYAMMQEEIVRARSQFVMRPKAQTLLLTLGGGTNRDAILYWLDCIARNVNDVQIVLLTSAPVLLPDGIRCRVICAPPDVGMVMSQADIALSAAGVTSLELACIGVPAMHVVLADNQTLGAHAAEREGIGINLGSAEQWNPNKFLKAYEQLRSADNRHRMSQRGRLLVDGSGPQRLVTALEKLVGNFPFPPLE